MPLEISNLHVSVQENAILNGINIEIKPGEVHVLMGPNGSGKSTLANSIAGHPKYKITEGSIKINNKEIINLKPNEIANEGIFLAFQHPVEAQGINIFTYLYNIAKLKDKSISPIKFRKELLEKIKSLDLEPSFLDRELNVGFSGGEKKKLEILQLLVIKPKIAILDEPDSGTDIDSLKTIALVIKEIAQSENIGVLLITHYNRILEYITPTHVHVIANGEIIKSGDLSLAQEIEVKGYKRI